MKRLFLILCLILACCISAFFSTQAADVFARRIFPVWEAQPLCSENQIFYNMSEHKLYICKNTGPVEVGGGSGSSDPQAANLIFSGPAAGASVAPTFRALVDADIPAIIALDRLSNLTGNGFIKTSGGNGTLSVDATDDYSVFNVKTYGALCDGVTDDYNAFVAANAAALAAGGGNIYVPPSTTPCVIGTSFFMSPVIPVNLIGAGMGASTIKRKSTLTGPFIVSGFRSKIMHLTVDGNYPARAAGNGAEITVGGDSTIIAYVEIKNPFYFGVEMAGTDAKVMYCILTGANAQTTEASYAIWAASPLIIRPQIIGNYIRDWTVSGVYGGATELLVYGNYFKNNHTQTAPTGGGQIANGSTGRMTVSYNYFDVGGGVSTSGLEIDNGAWNADHNIIISQQNMGIFLQGGSGHVLSNNRVSGSGVADFDSVIPTSDWQGNQNTPLSANNIVFQILSEGAVLVVTTNAITPTNSVHHVGAGLIKNITVPTGFRSGTITIIPDAAFTTDLTGNIGLASTAVVGRTMTFTYSSSSAKWYPSY